MTLASLFEQNFDRGLNPQDGVKNFDTTIYYSEAQKPVAEMAIKIMSLAFSSFLHPQLHTPQSVHALANKKIYVCDATSFASTSITEDQFIHFQKALEDTLHTCISSDRAASFEINTGYSSTLFHPSTQSHHNFRELLDSVQIRTENINIFPPNATLRVSSVREGPRHGLTLFMDLSSPFTLPSVDELLDI